MALRDLVASRRELNEAAIEDVVKDYVRYDLEKNEIILTPAATELSNRQKVLVYLVAVEGWVYLKPELESASARPSELEAALAIPGGTLRPLLRALASERLVRSEGGAYRIVAPNLSAVILAIQVTAETIASPSRSTTRPRARSRSKLKSDTTQTSSPKANKGGSKRSKANALNAAVEFQGWIDGGFFQEPKTMRQMLDEFHNKGIIMKMTTLSKMPLQAVRTGKLSRRKVEQDGRRVWVYTSR